MSSSEETYTAAKNLATLHAAYVHAPHGSGDEEAYYPGVERLLRLILTDEDFAASKEPLLGGVVASSSATFHVDREQFTGATIGDDGTTDPVTKE